MEGKPKIGLAKAAISAISLIVLAILVFSMGSIFENLPADEIMVIQSPVSGKLVWYFDPGLKWQGLGHTTHYKRSSTYWFSNLEDQGNSKDQSIPIRFNDGGHATISGSVRYDLPLTEEDMNQIHKTYGSQTAIEQQLVRTTFEKSVYMSGPMMSSKESYAERRNELLHIIEDQASYGVYKTTTKDVRGKDPMTGIDKTITVVEPILDPKAPGGIGRQEDSPFIKFNIKTYSLSINKIPYDETVEAQIKSQQQAIMNVQTAIAEAKRAEQDAITAAKSGEAAAAKAKWEQEVLKARAVTEAEQKFAVAELDRKTAEQKKAEQILLGEGEAERKKLVMNADGALQAKLEVYERVMAKFAEEFGKQKWVPDFQMNGTNAAGSSVNSATTLIDLLSAKAAKDLSLDMGIKGNTNPNTTQNESPAK